MQTVKKIISYCLLALMFIIYSGKSIALVGNVEQSSCHEMQQNDMQCCDDMKQCNSCAHCVNIPVLPNIIASCEIERTHLKIAAFIQYLPIILNLEIERPPRVNELT